MKFWGIIFDLILFGNIFHAPEPDFFEITFQTFAKIIKQKK